MHEQLQDEIDIEGDDMGLDDDDGMIVIDHKGEAGVIVGDEATGETKVKVKKVVKIWEWGEQ